MSAVTAIMCSRSIINDFTDRVSDVDGLILIGDKESFERTIEGAIVDRYIFARDIDWDDVENLVPTVITNASSATLEVLPSGSDICTTIERSLRTLSGSTICSSLESCHNLYRSIYEGSRVGLVIIDAETGSIVQANDHFVQITGRSREELEKMRIWDLRPPHQIDLARKKFEEVRMNGSGEATGLDILRPGDEVVNIRFLSNVVEVDGHRYIQSVVIDTTELVRRTEELERSERKFHTLIESAPISITILEGGHVAYMSPNGYSIHGYTLEELKVKDFRELTEIIHPDDRDMVKRSMAARLDGRDAPDRYDSRLITKDGDVRWVSRSVAVLEESSLLIVDTDITERKEMELELRASEERFRLMANVSPDALIMTDLRGRITYASGMAATLYGYDPSELIGMSSVELIEQDGGARAKSTFQITLDEGEITDEEFTLLRKDGTSFPGEVRTAVMTKSNGEPYGFISIARDLSARKTAIKTLQEGEFRFQQMADTIEDVFWITDWAEKQTIFASRAYEDIWDRKREALYANPRDWADAIHEEDRERAWELFVGLGEGDSYDEEYRIVRPDGSIRWVRDRGYPISTEEGNVYRVVGIAQDITDRKLLEKELIDRDARLLEAQRVAGLGFLDWNLMTDEIELSDQVIEMYGLDEDSKWTTPELVSKVCHPDDRDRVRERLEMAVDGSREYDIDHRIVRPDGTVLWVNAQARLTRDGDGNPTHLLGTVVDITERKAAEESSTRTAEDWRNTFDAVNDAIFILDRDQRIQRINSVAERWFEIDGNDIIGGHCWEIVHGSDEAIPECPIIRTRESLRRESMELQTGDRWFEVIVDPIVDAEGEFNGAAHIIRDLTLRKQAEMTLSENERLLAGIATNYPAYLSIIEKDWTIGFTSGLEFMKQGLDPEDFSGLTIDDVFGESADEVREHYARTFEGSEEEFEMFFNDQHQFYRSIPLFDEDGSVSRILAVVENITERKRTQELLNREMRRAQQYLDIAGVIFVAIDSDGLVTLINRKGRELLGYREDEIIGKRWFDNFIPERIRDGLMSVSSELLAGRTEMVEYHENPILTRSGEERLIAWHNTTIKDRDGNITGHLSSGEDITERRKAEERVRYLSSVVEQSSDGIAIASLEGHMTFVNDSWAAMHGYGGPEELIGEHLSIHHSEEQMVNDVEPFNREAIAKGFKKGEVGHIRKNGTTFPTHMTTTVLKDENGEPTALAGIATDITERKQAEEELTRSLREKEILLKEVHHRVKNNLQLISSLLDLRTELIDVPGVLEIFRGSQNQVRSMALIHRFLYETGDLTRIRMEEYLESIVENLVSVYADGSTIVETSYDLGDVSLDVDTAIHVGLMVNEIVTNSLKYAFEDKGSGTVTVSMESDSEGVRLSVGDDGTGLPPETGPESSEGLGLKLIDMLGHQMKASVSIERDDGTLFRIQIPTPPGEAIE